MTTHDRDKVIASAKLCGYWNGQTIEMNDVGIERFYAIAHEAGRKAEQKRCAHILEQQDIDPSFKYRVAEAIRESSTK